MSTEQSQPLKPMLNGRFRVDPDSLVKLQRETARIRNVCILAHVDHGKTTLSDGLVCSNGIISSKLAGKLRYLDSTADEQQRGITMRSSAISLFYELQPRGKRLAKQQQHEQEIPVEDITETCEDFARNQRTTPSPKSGSGKILQESSAPLPGPYLINLIDSPGHIDFSSDVSTATRLCDCGLIVVDVLEGVCPQTHAVLRQAWKEKMTPLLVLNKVDRLITEMRLTPLEAWQHLQRLIENVNALTSMLVTAEDMAEDRGGEAALSVNEEAEKLWTFKPENGDVVFTSALDGWGFGLTHFAKIWAKKLGARPPALRKMLWGDFAYSAKAKKVVKWVPNSAGRPMFVTMILEPIWQLYDVALELNDAKRTNEMASNVGIELTARELKTSEPRGLLQAVMKRWLPISNAVLNMVVELGPSPISAQRFRMASIWPENGLLIEDINPLESDESLVESDESERTVEIRNEMAIVKEAVETCSTSDQAPVVLFVSKMVPVRAAELVDISGKLWKGWNKTEGAGEDDICFIAFARIFSGTITPSTKLYILGTKYHPLKPSQNGNLPTVGGTVAESSQGALALYMMMGAGLHPVSSVPAGNVLAVAGLQGYVQKCATLSTSPFCPALTAITLQATPMVRVAVEAQNQKDMKALELGLNILYQADPAVEVTLTERGEHIISCLGELHLEQCLKDLKDQYARVEMRVSPPLISFRETVLLPGTFEKDGNLSYAEAGQIMMPGQFSTSLWAETEGLQQADYRNGSARFVVASKEVSYIIKCSPLPLNIAPIINRDPKLARILAAFLAEKRKNGTNFVATSAELGRMGPKIGALYEALVSALQENNTELIRSGAISGTKREDIEHFLSGILSFGPRYSGFNILMISPDVKLRIAFGGNNIADEDLTIENCTSFVEANAESEVRIWRLLQNSLVTGFQVAAGQGPLAGEEMYGVLFQVMSIDVTARSIGIVNEIAPLSTLPSDSSIQNGDSTARIKRWERFGPLSGQIISSTIVACRTSFLSCPVRLVEAFYECSLQCDQGQLGNMYAVLGRRRGQVTSEDIVDGTSLFLLKALLPVAESFGFAEELLKRTSGAGTTPQLQFSHWGRLPVDPFWKAQTEEEREDEGEEGGHLSMKNIARKYIDMTRKRKGLATADKIVIAAEKQRNLSMKK